MDHALAGCHGSQRCGGDNRRERSASPVVKVERYCGLRRALFAVLPGLRIGILIVSRALMELATVLAGVLPAGTAGELL
jgi:hypothetical protein